MARGIYGPWTDIDLDTRGRFVGTLNVPAASTRSAYRAIQVPILVVRGGDGPTVLLTGGTHGDEYEGQIALRRLAREIEPEWLAGGMIVMPALNLPAVAAAARLSPIDDGNLNSAYPGRVDGGPTSQIAFFVETELLPRVDAWIDAHSGGASLEYLPMPAIHRSEDAELDRAARAALRAFGAPISVEFGLQNEYASSTAAQRHGLVYLYGEFGGGGALRRAGLDILEAGVIRTLRHFGVLREDRGRTVPAPGDMAFYETVAGAGYAATRKCFSFAPANELYEPLRELGEVVEDGSVLGLLHDVQAIAAGADVGTIDRETPSCLDRIRRLPGADRDAYRRRRLTDRASQPTLSRTGLVLLALLSLLWGVNWPLIKIAIGDIPVLTFRAACTATGAAGLFLIARGAGLPLALPRPARPWIVAAALFNITGWNVFMIYGIGLVSAGRAAILGYTMPVWGVALSVLVLGERLDMRRAFGLALGLGGMAVLMGADAALLDSAPIGALLIVVAAMCWAAGTIVLKRANLAVPVTVSTAWQLVIGGAPIVVAAPVLDPGQWGPIGAASALAALYNMTVVFVFCYWAWFRILAEVPAGVAAISTLMIPIIGVFAGALALGEPVGWRELGALALVVAALVAVLRPGRARTARGS